MLIQIALNIMIAVVWMLLDGEWSNAHFAFGYVIGMAILGMLRRFWPNGFYMKKVWRIAKLLALFNKELFLSSFQVLKHVLRPKLTMRPGIIAFHTELRSNWEITLLSCLICLTPGTLTLDVSPDNRTLFIHAMDIEDAEELSRQLKSTFEKAIMEVTRT